MKSPKKMTTASIRIIIKTVFKLDSELSAFVMDQFPAAYKLFANSMDRETKLNILFEKIELEEIESKLSELYGKDILANECLSRKETGLVPKYTSQARQDIGEQLMALYQYRSELQRTGDPTDIQKINEEIAALQSQLRKDPVLIEGEFLEDGKYRFISQLGKGGFATVWKAFDWTEKKVVAIKILHPQWFNDQTYKDRFYQGSYQMSLLSHKNIVAVISPAQEEQEAKFHYFVMEYINGGDLRSAILAKRLSRQNIRDVIVTIGGALDYAHKRAVVHRDVKPANILLDTEQKSYLTDFDLVWNQSFDGGTRTNAAIGTFLYSAPEAMIDARNPQVQSDIYSLAMTTVFCLYGNDLPIDAIRSTTEFVHALKCNHELKMALLRGLNWNPEKRFSSVIEFTRQIEKLLGDEGSNGLLETVRSKPERTRLTYDVLRGTKTKSIELPLHILVLGNLYQGHVPAQNSLTDRTPISCSAKTIYDVLRRVGPILRCCVKNHLDGIISDGKSTINVLLNINNAEDLLPNHIIKKIPELSTVLDLRASLIFLGKGFAGGASADEDEYEQWFLTVALGKIRRAVKLSSTAAADAVSELKAKGNFPSHMYGVVQESWTRLAGCIDFIDLIISQGCQSIANLVEHIDQLLSKQLDEIIHTPEFQEIESTWSSIIQLAVLSDSDENIKISLLHCTKEEIINDLNEGNQINQTGIYYHIYSAELGTFGGHPYSMVVTNMEFGNTQTDIVTLKRLAAVSAQAYAMLFCGTSIDWFITSSPDQLADVSINDYMETRQFKDWRQFREQDDSQFLVMTLPRCILRPPYDSGKVQLDSFRYHEKVDEPRHLSFSNGAFCVARWVTSVYRENGWFPKLLCKEAGIVYKFDRPLSSSACALAFQRATLPEEQANALAAQGFLPILWNGKENGYQIHNAPTAFLGMPRKSSQIQCEEIVELNQFNTNAAYSQLIYMLVYCKIRHYLNSIVREYFRPFSNTEEEMSYVDKILNDWLRQYVSAQRDPDPGILRQRPLRFGRIDVTAAEVSGHRVSAVVKVLVVPHPLVDK